MDRIDETPGLVAGFRRAAARLLGCAPACGVCAAFAAALAVAVPAAAQDAEPADAPDPPSAEVEDRVTVIGRRLEGQTMREYASDFVARIVSPPSGDYGYARWDRAICVGVENLQEEPAAYIADRISDVAAELGLRPGAEGCTPNIVVTFAADGRALASHLVEERPAMFRPFGGEGGTTQGFHALNAFASSDAAVRWWQISLPVDWAGNIAITIPNSPFNSGPPTVAGSNSRITNGVRDRLAAAFIIVDASKLEGVNWGQLADYLAMVALAQIDPDAEPAGYDTILNLFSAGSVAGMTDWDMTFLQALYRFNQHRYPRQQHGVLASEIARQHRALER